MKKMQFTLGKLFAIMVVFCVIAAAVGYAVSGEQNEFSPLVFQLMLLSAPALLVVFVSLMRAISRK